MDETGKKAFDNYQIEDLVGDESFINYFFKLHKDDISFWEKWLVEHPQNNAIADAAKEMLRTLSLTLPEDEFNQELVRIKKAIHYETPLTIAERPSLVRRLPWKKSSGLRERKGMKIASVLVPLLLVFIGAGYYYFRHYDVQQVQLIEEHNDSGKPVVFTLSDGTTVTLAPMSVFRYPSDFGKKERTLYLDGEAQFDVSQDEIHPFKVYEGGLVATVLGTIFNVKEQRGDSVVTIELIKGKLKVETVDSLGESPQLVMLSPNERAVYRGFGQKLDKEKWQLQVDTALQVNHMVFRQNSFDEIAAQLKVAFGVTVVNRSARKTWRFTGEFNNSSAQDILKSICIVEKLEYEVRGDTVFIK